MGGSGSDGSVRVLCASCGWSLEWIREQPTDVAEARRCAAEHLAGCERRSWPFLVPVFDWDGSTLEVAWTDSPSRWAGTFDREELDALTPRPQPQPASSVAELERRVAELERQLRRLQDACGERGAGLGERVAILERRAAGEAIVLPASPRPQPPPTDDDLEASRAFHARQQLLEDAERLEPFSPDDREAARLERLRRVQG